MFLAASLPYVLNGFGVHFESLHSLKSHVVPVINSSVCKVCEMDYRLQSRGKKRPEVVMILCPIYQNNESIQVPLRAFIFGKSSVCELSLMPAVCRRFFSSHCVYRCLCVCWVCCTVSMFDIMRMKWPVMRLMFLMSELQINLFVLSSVCFFTDGTALVSIREHNTHFKRDTNDTKRHSA